MKSIEIAHTFVNRFGSILDLTNLKLNKLVYYAQVESIRRTGNLLFDDAIEAWQYGPVEPLVYHTFKKYGRGIVAPDPSACAANGTAVEIIQYVSDTYGRLSAFDLVRLSHRSDGAWASVYKADANAPITREAIVQSADINGFPGMSETLERGIEKAWESMPNALKLLENS